MSSIAAVLPAVPDNCKLWLTAVHSIEMVVCIFRRKSSNVCISIFVRELSGAQESGARHAVR